MHLPNQGASSKRGCDDDDDDDDDDLISSRTVSADKISTITEVCVRFLRSRNLTNKQFTLR